MTRMNPDAFRAHLARLEISQQGFARLIGVNPQTVRKWLRRRDTAPIPRAVEILLPLLTAAKVRRLVADREAAEDSQRGPVVR
jgi:DNA-binding transcriptional regulator YiaG